MYILWKVMACMNLLSLTFKRRLHWITEMLFEPASSNSRIEPHPYLTYNLSCICIVLINIRKLICSCFMEAEIYNFSLRTSTSLHHKYFMTKPSRGSILKKQAEPRDETKTNFHSWQQASEREKRCAHNETCCHIFPAPSRVVKPTCT